MEERTKPLGKSWTVWSQTYDLATNVNRLPPDLLPPPWEGRINLAILKEDGKITSVKQLFSTGSVDDLNKEARQIFEG